uniref:Uncharacterized protein n=1 Tax=Rhizophora mucronata TaxID=61149 RepID=A0A2P2JP16_RHIMU
MSFQITYERDCLQSFSQAHLSISNLDSKISMKQQLRWPLMRLSLKRQFE